MDFEQLKAFYTVAQTKNFTKAAETLHLVQSTVTRRIQLLEENIGKPLFIRNKRNVEITQTGQSLLSYAERILMLVQEGKAEISTLQPYEDRLTIGSTSSVWTVMEPILKEYHSRYPTIAVMTKTGHSPDVIQLLLDNIIQIAIVYIPPSLPNFEVIPCYEDDIVLVGGSAHPLSITGSIDIDELSTIPLAYVNWGSPFHDWVVENVPRSYVPKLQVDKAELAIDFVKAGIAVSLMPRSIIKQELTEGTLVEITVNRSMLPKRSAYVILHHDKKNRPCVEKWLELMTEFGYTVM